MFLKKNLTKVLTIMLIVVMGAGAFALFSPKASAKSEIKESIAYVDMQYLFENHPDIPAVKSKLNQDLQGLQQQLKGELQSKIEQVQGAEKQKLVQQYQQKLNVEANKRQKQLLKPINDEIKATIDEIAKEQGIAVVLQKDMIIYGGTDLTSQVLDRLKAKNKADKQETSKKNDK
ncbi:OmpH family outer membrane protein [Selenihalanaerobacter shriftii]|uniref:Periplasmic chaperone for outer membrane proteins Skp n=1 Tax=Selenihalanaerobacter shriftii TaxID=142842 RepID=A0A1T4KYW7_9FIRM|nr:OmpH family outer membrane protein [Selenihalanaerobacter shriftii]SJZ47616.1 periplasmic chaperone for outer membrane proteins Skp [Selenihalanaerobacter shriftii]